MVHYPQGTVSKTHAWKTPANNPWVECYGGMNRDNCFFPAKNKRDTTSKGDSLPNVLVWPLGDGGWEWVSLPWLGSKFVIVPSQGRIGLIFPAPFPLVLIFAYVQRCWVFVFCFAVFVCLCVHTSWESGESFIVLSIFRWEVKLPHLNFIGGLSLLVQPVKWQGFWAYWLLLFEWSLCDLPLERILNSFPQQREPSPLQTPAKQPKAAKTAWS